MQAAGAQLLSAGIAAGNVTGGVCARLGKGSVESSAIFLFRSPPSSEEEGGVLNEDLHRPYNIPSPAPLPGRCCVGFGLFPRCVVFFLCRLPTRWFLRCGCRPAVAGF